MLVNYKTFPFKRKFVYNSIGSMENKISWFYFIGRFVMVFLLRLLVNWEVRGKENVPKKGPILVVSNHMNFSDPPLVAVSVPRKLIFMAKEQLFRSKFVGYFMAGFGAFPIYKGHLDLAAMRRAKVVLEQGGGLVMFPEGKRSRSGKLLQAFPGSAMIAAQNDVPILPVGIIGTEKLTGKSWIFKRYKITVNIGQPFLLPHNGRVTRGQLIGMTDSIMCHIAELLPAEYHGCYTEKVRLLIHPHLEPSDNLILSS